MFEYLNITPIHTYTHTQSQLEFSRSRSTKAWSSNEASQWTAPEVQAWLVSKVGLIEATYKFASRNIQGQDLPLLLAKSLHSPKYLIDEFGIRESNKRAKLLTELSLLVLSSIHSRFVASSAQNRWYL